MIKLNFSTNITQNFETEAKIMQFNKLLIDAANGRSAYSAEEADQIIRGQFNKILGLSENFSNREFRQAWRAHKPEIYNIIEDSMLDKLVTGWPDDPFFMAYVEYKNLQLGDKNEFYVAENSLLQVSKFSGNHHDIVRQKVGYGKSFMVETSWYAIKVYQDWELFQAGKIDWPSLVNKMYTSIDKYRKDAIYQAFVTADTYLPTDLVKELALVAADKADVIELAETVIRDTGKNVAFIGTKAALSKLQALTPTALWSNDMKDELHKTGMLGSFEGYDLITIPRVNEFNSRKEATDNSKIYIMPIDPEFKPIKVVDEGDTMFAESGMDASKKDMTIEAELAYKEGIAVVINQLYGEIKIQSGN